MLRAASSHSCITETQRCQQQANDTDAFANAFADPSVPPTPSDQPVHAASPPQQPAQFAVQWIALPPPPLVHPPAPSAPVTIAPPHIAISTRGTHAQHDAAQPRRDHCHALTLVKSYSPALFHFMTYRNAQNYPSGHCVQARS